MSGTIMRTQMLIWQTCEKPASRPGDGQSPLDMLGLSSEKVTKAADELRTAWFGEEIESVDLVVYTSEVEEEMTLVQNSIMPKKGRALSPCDEAMNNAVIKPEPRPVGHLSRIIVTVKTKNGTEHRLEYLYGDEEESYQISTFEAMDYDRQVHSTLRVTDPETDDNYIFEISEVDQEYLKSLDTNNAATVYGELLMSGNFEFENLRMKKGAADFYLGVYGTRYFDPSNAPELIDQVFLFSVLPGLVFREAVAAQTQEQRLVFHRMLLTHLYQLSSSPATQELEKIKSLRYETFIRLVTSLSMMTDGELEELGYDGAKIRKDFAEPIGEMTQRMEDYEE